MSIGFNTLRQKSLPSEYATMSRRWSIRLFVPLLLTAALLLVGASVRPETAAAETTMGPLHTSGDDGVIYNSSNEPVRLVGYNWTGMEAGGRNDFLKVADVCGFTWRTPADRLPGLTLVYDDFYQNLRNWGYNVIRLPMEWNNLEPIAPTWDAQAARYVHNWNANYLNDLRSMIAKARAAGIMVILDMQQDFWSPALHRITNWDGSAGYCEGYGMPRWMYPSIDAKPTTTQGTDYYNGMNWFFRNIHDPMATVTRAAPWDLYGDVWEMLSYEFSAASGFPAYQAVVGADLFNEPWWSYIGGNPPAGQSVTQAAGSRLHAFYTTLAPSITANSPGWLMIFQDTGGRYSVADPSLRESPMMPNKPSAPGNWVYSVHDYNFTYATFSDGAPAHDDYGINLMNAVLNNARAWGVPLYIGEFTNFSLKGDARNLTSPDMEQTRLFVDWAKRNGVSWTFWAYLNPYLPMTHDGLRDQPAYYRRKGRARHRARRDDRCKPTAGRIIHHFYQQPAGHVQRVGVFRLGWNRHFVVVELRGRPDRNRRQRQRHLPFSRHVHGDAHGDRQSRSRGFHLVAGHSKRSARRALRPRHVLTDRHERVGNCRGGRRLESFRRVEYGLLGGGRRWPDVHRDR
jgi:aryl-phospho-beta-D-glucosidase BglC (GH1 family)